MKTNRSRLRRCSVRKGVLRNFAKFTGKRDSGTGVFCEFSEISNNNFFTEHLRVTALNQAINKRLLRQRELKNFIAFKYKHLATKEETSSTIQTTFKRLFGHIVKGNSHFKPIYIYVKRTERIKQRGKINNNIFLKIGNTGWLKPRILKSLKPK